MHAGQRTSLTYLGMGLSILLTYSICIPGRLAAFDLIIDSRGKSSELDKLLIHFVDSKSLELPKPPILEVCEKSIRSLSTTGLQCYVDHRRPRRCVTQYVLVEIGP